MCRMRVSLLIISGTPMELFVLTSPRLHIFVYIRLHTSVNTCECIAPNGCHGRTLAYMSCIYDQTTAEL